MTAKNYHIIEAWYVGASNFRGARVCLKDPRFKKVKYLSYDYSARDVYEQAEKYLKENGFTVLGHGEASKGFYIITSTFKSI